MVVVFVKNAVLTQKHVTQFMFMRYYLIAFVLDKNAVLTPPKICISIFLCVYLMACFTFSSAAQTLNWLVPYGKVVMPSNDLNLLLSLFLVLFC